MEFITDEKNISPKGDIVYYFYANWMPYHKKMVDILNKMKEEHNYVKFEAIDVDSFKNTIKRFNIASLPTIVIFKNDREVRRIVGIPMTSAVRAILNDIFDKKD